MSRKMKRVPAKPRKQTITEKRQIIYLLRKTADGAAAGPYSRQASIKVDCCTHLIEVMKGAVRHG